MNTRTPQFKLLSVVALAAVLFVGSGIARAQTSSFNSMFSSIPEGSEVVQNNGSTILIGTIVSMPSMATSSLNGTSSVQPSNTNNSNTINNQSNTSIVATNNDSVSTAPSSTKQLVLGNRLGNWTINLNYDKSDTSNASLPATSTFKAGDLIVVLGRATQMQAMTIDATNIINLSQDPNILVGIVNQLAGISPNGNNNPLLYTNRISAGWYL